MLAAGNTSMGDCAKATYEMTAACETLSRMARANSKHLPAMAKIAADLCKSCETECRKHAKSMEICKTCADSCASCYEQCKALGA
jgi:Cys-rich four helix bundle protein (predicted Tat secretion target)